MFWCLDARAAIAIYVTVFLEPDLGLSPNMIGAYHPTIQRGMRIQCHEHGRWLRAIDRDLETYANKYLSFLSRRYAVS